VWGGPATLPSGEELEAPALWLARVQGQAPAPAGGPGGA